MRADDHDRPLDDDGAMPPLARAKGAARRFGRLVRTGSTRRVSPRRLALGALAIGGLGWGGLEGSRIATAQLGAWVASQPEHQIPFEAIVLDPPPPPFIRWGAEGILASARRAGGYSEHVSALSLDAEQLRRDLAQSHWIEAVGSIRRSYRRLSVAVTYRQPTALIVYPDPRSAKKFEELGVLVDRQAVEMPSAVEKPLKEDGPFDWQEMEPNFVPRGRHPLIQIRGFGPCQSGRIGLPCVAQDHRFTPQMIGQAVDLAAFLQDRQTSTEKSAQAAPFLRIRFDEQTRRFWLIDAQGSEVFWGASPGAEDPHEPKAAEKWAMLQRFVAARGGALRLQPGQYLLLQYPAASIRQAPPRPQPTTPPSKVYR